HEERYPQNTQTEAGTKYQRKVHKTGLHCAEHRLQAAMTVACRIPASHMSGVHTQQATTPLVAVCIRLPVSRRSPPAPSGQEATFDLERGGERLSAARPSPSVARGGPPRNAAACRTGSTGTDGGCRGSLLPAARGPDCHGRIALV